MSTPRPNVLPTHAGEIVCVRSMKSTPSLELGQIVVGHDGPATQYLLARDHFFQAKRNRKGQLRWVKIPPAKAGTPNP